MNQENWCYFGSLFRVFQMYFDDLNEVVCKVNQVLIRTGYFLYDFNKYTSSYFHGMEIGWMFFKHFDDLMLM